MTTANFIRIFCILNEFCKYFTPELKKHLVDTSGKRRRNRPCRLSDSEVMTILVLFHTMHFRDITLKREAPRIVARSLSFVNMVNSLFGQGVESTVTTTVVVVFPTDGLRQLLVVRLCAAAESQEVVLRTEVDIQRVVL